MAKKRFVVLMSGGVESLVVAALASREGDVTHALFFDYGQNAVEKERRASWLISRRYGLCLEEVSLRLPFLTDLALLDTDSVILDDAGVGAGSQGHIVPFRNGVFMAAAVSLSARVGASEVWTGFDYRPGGALDKSPSFVERFESSAVEAGCPIKIRTPLQGNEKVDTVQQGQAEGVVWTDSWSCYNAFSFHCGVCGSCTSRRQAFSRLGVRDVEYCSREFVDEQLRH